MAHSLPAPPPPPGTVKVVLPNVHPLMLLPSALVAAVMLPLATVLAAAVVAAWIVYGATWPVLGFLFRALIVLVNYAPEVKS